MSLLVPLVMAGATRLADARAPGDGEGSSDSVGTNDAEAHRDDDGHSDADRHSDADGHHAAPLQPDLRPIDYLKPVGGLLGVNLAFWLGGKYVLRADYSDISWDSVAANVRTGFVWDDNHFITNQFGHPYQGGLYHAAARAAGLGYWAAVPFTVLGSLQWEYFMETEHPAYNDLLTTSWGGVAVGEVLYRLSLQLLDDSTSGPERFLRELSAAALSPTHGAARLLSGEAYGAGPGQRRQPLGLHVSAGLDRVRVTKTREAPLRSYQLRLGIEVGDLHPGEAGFEPFDYFLVEMGLNAGELLGASQLDLTGLVAGAPLACGDANQCVLGLVQHFDFFDTPIFKVGSSSFGGGLLARWSLTPQLLLATDAALLGIVLGGLDSPYAAEVGRDYNLGPGAYGMVNLRLMHRQWGALRLGATQYWVHTIHGADGDEAATRLRLAVFAKLWRGLGLGLAGFLRAARYERYDDLSRRIMVLQAHLHWQWERL